MKFIHIADVHMGMVPDKGMSWSEEAGRIIAESILKIIDICNQQKIDLLLIAGDLFHKQPLLRELKEINYALSKLIITKAVIIAGNHDYISERSHYRGFKWCEQVMMLAGETVQSVVIEEINTQVYGFSYLCRDITTQKYAGIFPEQNEQIHILLGHGGDEKNIPIDKNELKKAGFDYVALGHIHKPELIDSRMAYSGSLEPLDINETGEHGYIMGDITKQSCNIVFVPCAARSYHHLTVEVHPEMTEGEIADRAEEMIEKQSRISAAKKQNIVKLILKGKRSPELILDLDKFNRLGNVIETVDETVPDYNLTELYNRNRDNIIGKFIERIQDMEETEEIKNKALYYGLEVLLEAKE